MPVLELALGARRRIGLLSMASVAAGLTLVGCGGPPDRSFAELPQALDHLVWTQQQALPYVAQTYGNQFGQAVAIYGDTAVASDVSTTQNLNPPGILSVFTRTGTRWTKQAQFRAPDAADEDLFGWCLALSADTLVVGALGKANVYVYTLSGTTWTAQATLSAPAGNDYAFGYSVALSGDTVVVGSPATPIGSNSNQGAAYVFQRTGTTWTQQAKLVSSDGAAEDSYGYSVGISGDSVVVGANIKTVGGNWRQGEAYVYTRTGSTWSEQAQLTASDGAGNDLFGQSVAISQDTVVVGAPLKTIGAVHARGQGYVFVRSGTSWSEQQKLGSMDWTGVTDCGWTVALQGDTAILGAPDNAGQAYVYQRAGTSWTMQQTLAPAAGSAQQQFGAALALDGDTALITVPQGTDATYTSRGAVLAYVQVSQPESSNSDGSGGSSGGSRSPMSNPSTDPPSAMATGCTSAGLPGAPATSSVAGAMWSLAALLFLLRRRRSAALRRALDGK
jgi:hypothetical protein